MDVEVNYLAVLLAGASSMMVGAFWYSMNVFGKQWAKMAKVDMNRKPKPGEMAWLMGSAFAVSLVTAFVLAHVTYLSYVFFDYTYLSAALTTAFWLWLGFTATRLFTHDAFEGRRKKLTVLNLGNELATVMVMALIIGLIGL